MKRCKTAMHELLTPAQMGQADRLTIDGGIAGIELMEAAGRAVADGTIASFPEARKILIVCGRGNNAGDGFVAARILARAGLQVSVFLTCLKSRFKGDAAIALDRLGKDVGIADKLDPSRFDLVIDALFGAGLDRAVTGHMANMIDTINASETPVLAVDLPSGIDGACGRVCGTAIKAECSVTFFRKKPGHVLYPGRACCGEVVVRQIGIRPAVLEKTGIAARMNKPALWRSHLPGFSAMGHKYSRGHTLVVSGPLPMSGAARLVATAALRTGSGLVTLAGSSEVMASNAAQLTSVMLLEAETADALSRALNDRRMNCLALGPGLAPDRGTRETTIALLAQQRKTVLDAGALSAFEGHQDLLLAAIRSNQEPVVMTPHEGEFARLFPNEIKLPSKLDRALKAAAVSAGVIILKGPDSVVAHPDGRACIADNAPPWLATAGSGDVLAGIVAGLLAQGMPPFEAASAAVWIHGDAAARLGPPLVSSDLDAGLRRSLAILLQQEMSSH